MRLAIDFIQNHSFDFLRRTTFSIYLDGASIV